MSWFSFRPYVSVAERRRKAAAAAKKLTSKSGKALSPVHIAGRTIASTFWGKAWCDNLESYSDYESRLPRGRAYVRNGSVIDLQISTGKVQALVQGSSLYKITIGFGTLPAKHWADFKNRHAGKVTNLLDLLQGRLSKDILVDITSQGPGLFPSPKEIDLGCSCPDWADMCKHVAAVLYGIGARLDEKPELFFTLRGVDMQELLTAASASATEPLGVFSGENTALEGADLAEMFGVEIESSTPVPPAPAKPKSARPKVRKEPGKEKPGAAKRKKAVNITKRNQQSPRKKIK